MNRGAMSAEATEVALDRLWSLGDYTVPLTLRAVSDLGVADYLAAGPMSVEELAERTGADADALRRALRLLTSLGVFAEPVPDRFELTPTGQPLRSDHPLSARETLSLLPADLRAWAEVDYSLRTGRSAFERVHGSDRWAYFATHPAHAERFHRRMRSAARRIGGILAGAYPWKGTEHVVDVGGGSGGVLAELLSAYPGMRGTLFDQPSVVAAADEVLGPLGDRCTVTGGDFFAGVPAGGDVYLLVNVVHDWADGPAAAIIGSVGAQVTGTARLLVVEGVPGVDGAASRSGSLDMHMLVVWGGRERRLEEWTALLSGAGLRLCQRLPAGPRWILECASAG
jgi:hypothetical protein